MSVIVKLLSGLLEFLFKGVVIKFFIFFGLFYITTEFIPVIIELFIPNEFNMDFQSLLNQLPNDIWYFLELFKVPYGLSLYISAMLARFIIRRIPVVG
ncbi:DUF2523 domain-containing protein [Glaesserella parasuis]|uniref:DUF2523 family protein n=1 Tax=Pasteurellaceae TaxID=712 RepID=UPI000991BBB8|nr:MULTISPECIES: DUF2523 family protein [Pasteurellaceae]MCT8558210.1 DUF2523 domain-containing protein [Glaesserella parasuis]MCT8782028.1 DUF2523 domain-containing protein [Glaesserella parasuis]MCT8822331.1 DUF2523 domain-containing protein [Glaesserella parasuis]MDD6910124.1 DUF2523 domain-containing protein [Actinobacillus minor]OOR87891.1 DUF2523 domain-containing protein [Glaesserella parasuis]